MDMSKELIEKRTTQQRIEAIFKFIDTQNDVFPKSQLKQIGLNPRTAETWLKMIEYIQNQPRIRLVQTDHNVLVEKVEKKYQAMMRNKMIDESLSFEQRSQHLTDYLKSFYTLEKMRETSKISKIKPDKSVTSIDPHSAIIQLIEILDTFSILDPIFIQFNVSLKEAEASNSDEQILLVLSKWQKEIFLNGEFQQNLKRILSPDYYIPRLKMIVQKIPDYVTRLNQGKHILQTYYSYLRETIADWFFTDQSEIKLS